MSEPTLDKITKHNGMAGQVAYEVTTTYPGEQPATNTFVGSEYGSPGVVSMYWKDSFIFVDDPGRFGETFDERWVRRYFGEPYV